MIKYKDPETVELFGYRNADERKLVHLVERWEWPLTTQFDEQIKIAYLEDLVSKGANINLLNKYGNKLDTIAKSPVLKT